MKKPLIVKDSVFILILSILCIAFFSLCLIFSTISFLEKQDMESLILCALIFGGFTLSGILLFIYCIRRRLVFYDDHIVYTPSFGRTRHFTYSEIQSVVQKREKFIIYSYDGTKLAVFENNMPAYYAALCFLDGKYVKIIPQSPAAGMSSGSSTDAALNLSSGTTFRQKIADWNKRLNLTDKNAYLRSRYSAGTIQKQKRIIRNLHIALIILSLLAFFFPLKGKLAVYILIMLFHYFVFLLFYPKLTAESAKKCDGFHIPFPMTAGIICLFFLMLFMNTVNMEDNWWFSISAALFLILFIPFLIMLILLRMREHPLILLWTAVFLFFLCFMLTPAVSYISSYKPVHDTVIVLDKSSSHNSYLTSYDIFVMWRGSERKMAVSGNLYKSVNAGDSVRVCVRKSILGAEIWKVHH